MADILEEIVAHKRIEMEQRKRFISPRQMVTLTDRKIKADEGLTPGGSMRDALMSSSTGIIAEFKRKSPSKGWIKEEGKASVIPLGYQQNGASALSILTDIDYFGGYDEYIQEARHVGVTLPILYKNFVVEEYQLLQARYCGASAVLLIAACLTKQECKDLLNMAHQLGLEVLLEMHNAQDFEYAELAPRYVWHQQPQPRNFRYRCGEQFPPGRTVAQGCMQSERKRYLQSGSCQKTS